MTSQFLSFYPIFLFVGQFSWISAMQRFAHENSFLLHFCVICVMQIGRLKHERKFYGYMQFCSNFLQIFLQFFVCLLNIEVLRIKASGGTNWNFAVIKGMEKLIYASLSNAMWNVVYGLILFQESIKKFPFKFQMKSKMF